MLRHRLLSFLRFLRKSLHGLVVRIGITVDLQPSQKVLAFGASLMTAFTFCESLTCKRAVKLTTTTFASRGLSHSLAMSRLWTFKETYNAHLVVELATALLIYNGNLCLS